jgi:UDP-N-acetylmuramoyl-L-alanyl-D-glutamate--2,6-diaminopimelate ligase
MKLRELLRDVKVKESGADLGAEIASVTADSRMVVPGALFVAIPGFKTDGAKFIDAAVRKGAAAIVGESSAASVQVDDARAALSTIAAVPPTNSHWSVSRVPPEKRRRRR